MLGLTPFAMISLTGIIFVILGLFLYIRGWSSKTFIYMENGIGNIIVGLIIFTYLIWISISSKNYINLNSGFGLLFVLLNVVSYISTDLLYVRACWRSSYHRASDRHITMSPCHPVTMSPCHRVTTSPGIQCTVYGVQYTRYSVQCTSIHVYSAQHTT